MKRKMFIMLVALTIILQMTACGLFNRTCKASGCDETDIYSDGYCRFHYYENVGSNLINDLFD